MMLPEIMAGHEAIRRASPALRIVVVAALFFLPGGVIKWIDASLLVCGLLTLLDYI